MNKHQSALRSMALAHEAIQKLMTAADSIVEGMANAKMHSVPGIQFARIPKRLLPPGLFAFQQNAGRIGIDLELELIRLVGTTPPHIHRKSGGVVVKCGPTLTGTEALLDHFGKYPKVAWQKVKPGEIFFTPVGMVHGLRFVNEICHEPAHFFAVNAPAILEDDVVYV